VTDLEEYAQDAEEQGISLSLLELEHQTMRGIEAALRRLDAGELGTCSDCEGAMSAARLRALPFASRCLLCQQQHDRRTAAAPRFGSALTEH
jgi:DnaK suppressor protein